MDTIWEVHSSGDGIGLRFFMWTVFKVFTESVNNIVSILFWFLGYEACGISAPQPGIKPTPSALEGEVLTPGLPGKFLNGIFIVCQKHDSFHKKTIV